MDKECPCIFRLHLLKLDIYEPPTTRPYIPPRSGEIGARRCRLRQVTTCPQRGEHTEKSVFSLEIQYICKQTTKLLKFIKSL